MTWQMRTFAVGGLWAVGFGANSDLLLVISVNGRGVFDCVSGERVARDPSDDDAYDEDSETAAGIGPLAGARIEICGANGGIVTRRRLPLTTHDGWVVAKTDEMIVLRAEHAEWTTIAEVEELSAIGFSPTGRSLVAAESHTLHVWSRSVGDLR